jgi:hypothetical protein
MNPENSEKRFFDRQEELMSNLYFLIDELASAYNDVAGETDTVRQEASDLIDFFGVLHEEIEQGELKEAEDKLELFKLKVEKFLEKIKPYSPKDEIPKKQVN